MEKIKKYWFKKKRYIKQRINLKNKMDFAITQQPNNQKKDVMI
jgi:hypothetical protein